MGIYSDVDIDAYHKEEGISSSGISLILDCPKRYHHEYMDGGKKTQCKESDIGRAVHMYALEPEKFNDNYFVMEASIDLRTKAGKDAKEKAEIEAGSRTILRLQEAQEIFNIGDSVRENPLWNRLKDGKIEHSIYWDAGIFNTRLRARPDIFNDGLIVDLKTTESIKGFARSIHSYGYHRQAAMQIDGLQSIDGKRRAFAFFVVEKKAPYLTATFVLDEESIEHGRKEYLEGARIYSECLINNDWPGYDNVFQKITLPKWLMKEENQE